MLLLNSKLVCLIIRCVAVLRIVVQCRDSWCWSWCAGLKFARKHSCKGLAADFAPVSEVLQSAEQFDACERRKEAKSNANDS